MWSPFWSPSPSSWSDPKAWEGAALDLEGGIPFGKRFLSRLRGRRTLAYGINLGILLAMVLAAGELQAPYFTLSLILAGVYISLALAWDFSSGLTGYVNFGLPFFFGLGAFATGYLDYHGVHAVPELLAADFAVGLGGGLLFALPTLRLRGPYFTFLSLLLPLIGTDVVLAYWVPLGLPTVGYYNLPFLAPTGLGSLLIVTGLNGLWLTLLLWLRETHFGLVLRGIRDDEEALEAQGLRSFPYKVVAFALSNGIVGVAGGVYAMTTTFAGIDAFGFLFLLFPILIAILGGPGEIVGCIGAGFAVILLSQYLDLVMGPFTLILFSGLALVLVLFLPGGFRGLWRWVAS
jgi:branched-chain amino acid transport system permease protein